MIEIKITDPHLIDKTALRKITDYLLSICEKEEKSDPMRVSNIHVIDGKKQHANEIQNTVVAVTNSGDAFLINGTQEHNLEMEIGDWRLDSRGELWDEKIHSRTKSKNADGSWKLKRGTVAIETPVKNAVVPPPPPIELPVEKNSFENFMEKLTYITSNKLITSADVLKICQNNGLSAIYQVSTNTHLIPKILSDIENLAGEI